MDEVLLLSLLVRIALLVRIGCAFFFFFLLSKVQKRLKCEQCSLTLFLTLI